MDDKFEQILKLIKEILLDLRTTDDESLLLSSIHEDLTAVYEMTMDRRLAALTTTQQELAKNVVPGAAEGILDAQERVRNRLITAGVVPSKGGSDLPN